MLVGNPNVGKSLLFSRLTGIGVISSNYAGTTVEVKTGRIRYSNTEYELFDIPGIYSLESFSKADDTAIKIVDEADIIINVIDATSLERNLNLTLQLLEKKIPVIVCLNFWDDTGHRGITIDPVLLQDILGVKVVTTSALSGEGMKTLVASLVSTDRGGSLTNDIHEKRDQWARIGEIVKRVQKLEHRHHTFRERIADFTIHPVGGVVSAVVILFLTFVFIRFVGEWLVNGLCDPLFTKYYNPLIHHLGSFVPVPVIRDIFIGHSVDPLASFGILTTGVYIALVLVFPYFVSFYFIFGFLEDSGYLPRLAVVLDAFFHRIGLHGYSSIPVMLGLGCKVPAFLATRVLTSRREKILTMALVLMSAPCLPQSAMIISLGMRHGVFTVIAIFAILFFLSLLVNTMMSRLMGGESQELFVEIPAYRFPSAKMLVKKLRYRVIEYIREVGPMIILGVLVIHILDSFKLLTAVSDLVGIPISWLLGLPHDIAPVMVLGFLRKDVSIALLAPFNLDRQQFIVASIFMVLYIPCIASFFTLIKELGIAAALKTMGIVFVSAITVTALLHGIFVLVNGWGLKLN
jgi:ferrous iron transport protein B